MRSGTLNRRIVVERATATANEYGTPVEAWAPLATLRAELVTQDAREFLDRRGTTDVEALVFRTRFLEGVTQADRVSWKGTAYNIREVVLMEHDRAMELRCEAQNGGAS